MSRTYGQRSTNRTAVFLLLVFFAPITQAAEFASPSSSEFEATDWALLQTVPLNLVSASDAGSIGIFEAPLKVPLVRRITGFGLRQGTADGGRFNDLDLQAVFVDFGLPWQWSPWGGMKVTPRITLELGRFANEFEHREFGSLGPTFRFEPERSRIPFYVDLGLSPTVIDGANYGNRNLGTSLNFTSHVGLGLRFGRNRGKRVSFRYQHISNGGISSTNPGVNSYGIDFVFWSRQ